MAPRMLAAVPVRGFVRQSAQSVTAPSVWATVVTRLLTRLPRVVWIDPNNALSIERTPPTIPFNVFTSSVSVSNTAAKSPETAVDNVLSTEVTSCSRKLRIAETAPLTVDNALSRVFPTPLTRLLVSWLRLVTIPPNVPVTVLIRPPRILPSKLFKSPPTALRIFETRVLSAETRLFKVPVILESVDESVLRVVSMVLIALVRTPVAIPVRL